jgi:hypothetical protein
MLTLSIGLPTMLIVTDERTLELAIQLSLPFVSVIDAYKMNIDDFKEFILNFDYSEMILIWSRNASVMKNYLKNCNLTFSNNFTSWCN